MKKIFSILFSFLLIHVCNFASDSTKVKQVGPGILHHSVTLKEGPVEIDILEIDMTNPEIEVNVGIANDRIAHDGELALDFVKRKEEAGELIYGAVNGDFFGGNPWQAENSMVVKSEFAKGIRRSRTQFGLLENNKPVSGNFKFYGLIFNSNDTIEVTGLNVFPAMNEVSLFNYFIGDYLTIPDSLNAVKIFSTKPVGVNESVEFEVYQFIESDTLFHIDDNEFYIVANEKIIDELKTKFHTKTKVEIYLSNQPDPGKFITLIGGLPGLVKDGIRPQSFVGIEGLSSEKFIGLNPRTAVGFTRDGTKLFIVTVDGRQKAYSVGMSLYDLADYMISLGCEYAVNLDGGGSTTMVVRDSLVNSPSDSVGARPVHNFLYVENKNSIRDSVAKIDFAVPQIKISSDKEVTLYPKFFDRYGYQIPVNLSDVEFSLRNGNMEENAVMPLKNLDTGEYQLTAQYRGLTSSVKIVVQ